MLTTTNEYTRLLAIPSDKLRPLQRPAPMTELAPVLDRLGLQQYREKFVDEGFEVWETVLDITEADLYVVYFHAHFSLLINQ